jgi:hypothetical protein
MTIHDPLLVEHDGHIKLWDVRGKIYWSIPGMMYDIHPKLR